MVVVKEVVKVEEVQVEGMELVVGVELVEGVELLLGWCGGWSGFVGGGVLRGGGGGGGGGLGGWLCFLFLGAVGLGVLGSSGVGLAVRVVVVVLVVGVVRDVAAVARDVEEEAAAEYHQNLKFSYVYYTSFPHQFNVSLNSYYHTGFTSK